MIDWRVDTDKNRVEHRYLEIGYVHDLIKRLEWEWEKREKETAVEFAQYSSEDAEHYDYKGFDRWKAEYKGNKK
jgi:hypothetical protein